MSRSPSFSEIQALYRYTLPPELIATLPASPRDSARLLIYDRRNDNVTLDTFHNIGRYLPKSAVLVLNDTKVFPARMMLKKSTGGKVEALYLSQSGDRIHVLASGKFQAGDILQWKSGHTFTVMERNGKEAILLPSFPCALLPSLLEEHGAIPLPPYIEKSPLTEQERRKEYQTVFAKYNGSIAAPTAGLHFTEELLQSLQTHDISIEYVTLHVHLGTFAPLEENQWKSRQLHTEHYVITPDTAERLNAAKQEGRPIVAVGTTTVRTLESACTKSSVLNVLHDNTSIFITEDSQLHFTDHLVTNFHLPGTSLLMLVAAFTGREKLLELYKKAIAEKMRFYSFGDGMIVL